MKMVLGWEELVATDWEWARPATYSHTYPPAGAEARNRA